MIPCLSRVAVDVGGTFTDIIITVGDLRIFTYKELNIPGKLGEIINRCIIDSLQRFKSETGSSPDVGEFVLATTKCSNAVLEKSGAVTGLLCTEGYRDVLELRDGQRPPIYDIFWEPEPPIVPRRRRLEVAGRMYADGSVKDALNETSVREAIKTLQAQGVEAIAIAYLHSYSNSSHEKETIRIVQEMAPNVSACASHEILPEIREYPRTSTTVVNAYLMKVANQYFDDLESQLGKYDRPLLVMQSNGGTMTSALARRQPVRLLESGPAAGVLAVSALARELGLEKAVAFDMGGTTVKACLIENGKASETIESEVGAGATGNFGKGAGFPIRIPSFDIVELGAGGGSIAYLSEGVLLRVGPESAGAVPGPVCYGRGGSRPTVTDANVILGYMSPESIAGGAVRIDVPAARSAIEREIANPLNLSVEAAAHGIHRVANATMARAVRAVTSERGRDPREFTIIAFGGSGPIHAATLAEEIGIKRTVVPLFPGLFSAVGLQFAEQTYGAVRNALIYLGVGKEIEVLGECDEASAELQRTLDSLSIKGEARFEHYLELRQGFQTFSVNMQVPETRQSDFCQHAIDIFHEEHESTYGYRREEEPVYVANIRTRATVLSPVPSPRDVLSAGARERHAVPANGGSSERRAVFGSDSSAMTTRLISRAELATGPVRGPAIIEEFDTTIVVPPQWSATVDNLANVVLDRD